MCQQLWQDALSSKQASRAEGKDLAYKIKGSLWLRVATVLVL